LPIGGHGVVNRRLAYGGLLFVRYRLQQSAKASSCEKQDRDKEKNVRDMQEVDQVISAMRIILLILRRHAFILALL
jgi:hypothetical protein